MALSNQQYESIIREYESIRDENRHRLELRRNEVYQRIPAYEQLEDQISSLSISAVRRMFSDDNTISDTTTRLHDSLADIAEQKRELLMQSGYPADYLDPIYRCLDCKDTGYIENPRHLKQKCHCFRQRELDLLYEQSNIREVLRRENFSTLSYEYYEGEDLDHFRNSVKNCQKFVQNFKQDYQNLFFYGTVGVGKSFLSGCIANELLNAGSSVIYFSASRLFDTLAVYAFSSKSKSELSAFCEDIYTCDLLIIDDLGTELTNTFVASQLFTCINERQLRRKPVIISTNLNLEELRTRYSDRVFSRITSSYTFCKLTGPDIRMQKKMQGSKI